MQAEVELFSVLTARKLLILRMARGSKKPHIAGSIVRLFYGSENGSDSSRSFGRVIYTEGKSLIFYAFDLDKTHGGRKVSFEAWGEKHVNDMQVASTHQLPNLFRASAT